jgi:hypothetical protein
MSPTQVSTNRMRGCQRFQLISLLYIQSLLPHSQGQPGNFSLSSLSISTKSHSLSHLSYRSKQYERILFLREPTDHFVAEMNKELAFARRRAPIVLRRPSVRKSYATMAGRGFRRPMYNPLSAHTQSIYRTSYRVSATYVSYKSSSFFQSSIPLDARIVFWL